MQLLVLGSAAGGGFPQWNCNCANCRRARRGDPAAKPRTQSSLAVRADGGDWVLLNASPDLRTQLERTPPLHPRAGGRDSPIAGVVLTNADVDHVAGLLTLRESQPLALYATPRILDALAANPVFGVLNPDHVARRPMALDRPLELCDRHGAPIGLRIEAFAVPGKVALYLEDPAASNNFGTAPEDTIALEVQSLDGAGRFFYVPGCAAMTPELADRIDGAALVLFDGTLWRDNEMIAAGVGHKTGQRMGHLSMSGPEGAIAAFAAIAVGRKLFIHINNTNPVLLADSAERATAEAAGWEIAEDGMEIVL